MTDNNIHISDFYYDSSKTFIRDKKLINTTEQRQLMKLNGRYAWMKSNSGHLTPCGTILPSYIQTDEDAVDFILHLTNSFNLGIEEGRKSLKKEIKDLLS